MKGSKVLKTFIIGSLLVGPALAGPSPSTTVSTQPNPMIKSNSNGEREIYMGGQYFAGGWYRVYDWLYSDGRWYNNYSYGHAYVIIDTARQGCIWRISKPDIYTVFRTVCLRNPRFRITEGNLGDLFISSVISNLAVLHENKFTKSYCEDGMHHEQCYTFHYLVGFLWGNPCVKGILIHDGGSIPGKLCVISAADFGHSLRYIIKSQIGFVFFPW